MTGRQLDQSRAGPKTTWESPEGGNGAENQSLGWWLLGLWAKIQNTVFLPWEHRHSPWQPRGAGDECILHTYTRWAVP